MYLPESFRGRYWHVHVQNAEGSTRITSPSGTYTEGTEASTGQREPIQAPMESMESRMGTCMYFQHQNEQSGGRPRKTYMCC